MASVQLRLQQEVTVTAASIGAGTNLACLRTNDLPLKEYPMSLVPEIVVRAALKSPTPADENRRLARDLVWSWVGTKWPRLVPPRAQLDSGQLHCTLPGRRLTVHTSEDGAAWTLEIAYSERDGACTWTTRAVVADLGDSDLFALQTTCAPLPAQRRIAPPRVLGRWVDRLRLDDAGVPVQGEPHPVEGQQLAALYEHLLSRERSLPVVVLGNQPGSRYYGVDPRGLAEAVCGLAHVACLTPQAIAAFTGHFGRRLAPESAAVRIYMPGFGADADYRDHPLLRLADSPNLRHGEPDAGAFRRAVCERICELSVVATRAAFGAA